MSASPQYPFRNDLPRDSSRATSVSSRPRAESKHVALPSIRQTFPELHLEGSLADVTPIITSVHKAPLHLAGSLASPEYVHSPNGHKKRRISNEDEQAFLRAKQVPRLYRSPEAPPARALSPARAQPTPLGAKNPWTGSPSRSHAYSPHITNLTAASVTSRADPRPALPSLPPTLKLERDARPIHRPLETSTGSAHSPRPGGASPMPSTMERHSSYQSQDYGHAYQHPSRFQSLSTSSIRSYGRGPFSAGATYGHHYPSISRYTDIGNLGIGSDAKQRKRRGNLPKETTDKLRSWFVAHLQHPYPTEDEKQELMRQTGLQMNQISNWFINARRRQLPAMINNARAESDAMNGRSSGSSGDGTVLASTEQGSDYSGHGKRDDALPLSDGEGGGYDDDVNKLHCRRPADRLSL
ncbi:homeodomain-containing protein [Metarhizium album ARSEF 1941]|uniref:Homeodomain-containing protein n=1 Tax=Metarhizium album (strain ARSEF 1941) TaxID=1081103 RepID=A0A0B2X4Y4_METAS|nr:homeodomain-containing protein [Metarhizium album ARSEF 1941]KHO00783.1 homeodomain-containing protein [Metarhizium album ARSEF 1941]